ncbi:MoaD family protein [Chloroherpeton thalassium ATCC 35110]|uniref:Molybdopterin synthase sulfur carrier subunit n=1 Tax=Chloroherpeton thalassium (strain ATCC 35110 / GB-78) TaxID=517418 RepID=B3QZC4_CHLT3|nr:MoaD/ThiS family protein [Chloroherpeton thalassium]ACF13817.1 MoaD family protein [Chloroherpeton thalassium ATCC 35110]
MEKTITVTVRCFSLVSDALGKSAFELDLPHGATAKLVLEKVRERMPAELNALPIRIAVNQEYILGDAELQHQDEVALIPPVSGG